jgi:urease subunit gamma/beta
MAYATAMRLTPTERDRLLLFTAAELARARKARGLRLNVPEATAIIADTVAEAARDGLRLMDAAEAGRNVLGASDVMEGVLSVVTEVKVEAVFDDGTRLVVVRDPFRFAESKGARDLRNGPGSVMSAPINEQATATEAIELTVTNMSDVPISITSHFHFFEVNSRLNFDRKCAYGMRLAIAAGSAQRFEPSIPTVVHLLPIGGDRVAIGFAGLVDGPLDAPGAREASLARAVERGFLGA